MKYLKILLVILLVGCTAKNETEFSNKALNETFMSLDGVSINFKEVINKYKGKKVLIDIWASWCGDCIKGMPTVVKMQKEYKDVVFLFLSIDNSLEDLRDGVKKYNVMGEHYLLPSKWDGDFGDFLGLSWIPRYLVVDEKGKISVFNAIKANDKKIVSALI